MTQKCSSDRATDHKCNLFAFRFASFCEQVPSNADTRSLEKLSMSNGYHFPL